MKATRYHFGRLDAPAPGLSKAYIAGPMSGIVGCNFSSFDLMAAQLMGWGWRPVNPAAIDRTHGIDPDPIAPCPDYDWGGDTRDQIIDRDLRAIRELDVNRDALFLLTGWQESVGTMAEVAVARWRGLDIVLPPRVEGEEKVKAGERQGPGLHPHTRLDPELTKITGGYARAAREQVLEISEKTGEVVSLDSGDASERKATPVCTGVLDYFPDALSEVARVSKAGNDQHNPGQPLHWAKEKSTDEADALARHLLRRGRLDKDGMRHSAKVAWRALALLQREIDGEHQTVTKFRASK
jgi:hypothetical protein